MRSVSQEIITVKESDISHLLSLGQHQYWHKLNRDLLVQFFSRFKQWPQTIALDDESGRSREGRMAQHIVSFLLHDLEQSQQKLERMKSRYAEYSQRYTKAISDDEKTTYMLNYAQELGATGRQLKADRLAFKRWFGHDALSDRYRRRHLQNERYLSFSLQCLGRIAALAIQRDGEAVGYQRLWQRLALQPVIEPLLDYDGDKRVIASAFHALTEALLALPVELQHHSVTESGLRFIYHACLSHSYSVWIQCEALQLMQTAKPDALSAILSKRFKFPAPDDDLFVRRKAVEILGQQLVHDPELQAILPLAIKDASPAVRQKLPAALLNAELAVIEQFYPVLLTDSVEQVRAAALLNLTALMQKPSGLALAIQYLNRCLQDEQQRFVLRVALKVCQDGVHTLQDKTAYLAALLPTVEKLHQQAEALSVRRWAAQTREYLLAYSDAAKVQQLTSLHNFITRIPPGKTRRIPQNIGTDNNTEMLRLLSVIAQQDFGFDVEAGRLGYFITRGHAFGFRLWRFLHEFRYPSPDKRQAFSHTRGRLFWGTYRVPSGILSELAETKVPGEPLYIDTEDGWRGYLPLVDDVISALALGNRASWFYHSEGVTRIQPPASRLQRWQASWRISYYFTRYADLRNWQENSQQSPASYLQALSDLGIKVSFQGHDSELGNVSEDPSVLRFFPVAIPYADMQLWQEFKDYFVSVYENTLYELAAFLSVAIFYFAGKHVYLYRKFKKARNNLPLVLGGWGTRGKSGTERIKAALMNALGYAVVSKTTGCEAMFLHAHPYGDLKEMFLFRPYDKATIWEQHNLVCLADKLNCEVFLWECMGLTPAYIDILQRQWMCDDIATITNTYPDHEDLQGPAGVNIPEVMTQFIPPKSTILTTEEQMLPILRAEALQRKTRFRSVGWLEAGMLTEDVLERFPYDEHPFNIALVMAMGEELGVDGDYALKEMADRVVADIGVLKTYPCAPWRSRRLEFINGMSANERFGCLGNWQRMGLDKLNLTEHPGTWVTTVVNNRADRIARSRVFASILVEDISFDRCVLIGNNLNGMLGYIKEAWNEWVGKVSLNSGSETPEAVLLRMAQRFRIPHNSELVHLRFQAMLQGQDKQLNVKELDELMTKPEALTEKLAEYELEQHKDILQCLQKDLNLLASFDEFLLTLQQTGSVTEDIQQQFARLLWKWYEQKLVIVEDYYASGNDVISTIADQTPPGFYNRILGMQNIKGTGLDFVYRWQAWENCFKACEQLLSSSPAESDKGLAALLSIQEFGWLAQDTVSKTVETVKDSQVAQNEHYQAALELIRVNLETSLKQLNNSGDNSGNSESWLSRISQWIESFLDAGDAVKRRKKADQIYQDLIDERISHDRAVLELQALNKRQKGGWFSLG